MALQRGQIANHGEQPVDRNAHQAEGELTRSFLGNDLAALETKLDKLMKLLTSK